MERYTKYLVVSCLLVVVFMVFALVKDTVTLGVLGWFAFLLSGTFFIGTGALLGALFLDFVRPDVYLVQGAVDSFYKRIFWTVGPQVIGGLIGFMATKGFMANVLGYVQFSG